jgi:hypothetical protein
MVDSVRSKQASLYAIALQQADEICLCVRDPDEDSAECLFQRGCLTQHGASLIHSNWGSSRSAIREGSAVHTASKYQLPTDPKKWIPHLCDIAMRPPESACMALAPQLNATVAVPSTILAGPCALMAVILSKVP